MTALITVIKQRRLGANVAALFLLLSLLSQAGVYAQNGVGEIWGRVADPMGQAVVHGAVTVMSVDSGAIRHVFTDNDGRFAAPALPVGRYQVTVEREGYAARRQDDIVLLPGQRISIEMQLRRAVLPETIALSPYPPLLESTRTHASAFVAETEIHELPIAGRRYLRLAELLPAVTRDAVTGGVSVMALPSTQNRIVIDGFDHTSSITGEPVGREGPARVPYQLSQWAVNAFRINISGSPAEIGRAGASVINVVTKSGANQLRASAYELFGNRALVGHKVLDEQAGLGNPAYRSNQFGAVVGGPIIKDHNFFLVSYEGLQRIDSASASPNTTLFSSEPSATLQRLNATLARDTRDQDQDLILARTDHEYFGQHLTLRYIDQQFAGQAIDAARIQPAISSNGTSFIRTRSGAGSLATVLGSAGVNEARVQYADSHDTEDSPTMPGVVVWQSSSFAAQTGTSLFGPHAFATKRLQVGDSVSVVASAHSLKAGADVLQDRNGIQFRGTHTYGFQTISGFASGTPRGVGEWLTQTFDARSAGIKANVDHYSAYLQDAWRASRSVTVDLGVRYDLQLFAGGGPTPDPQLAAQGFGSVIPADRTNWAPRAGLAWAPGARTHVFRAAYGLFYGATPAMISALAQTYDGINGQAITVRSGSAASLPAYPNQFASIPTATQPSVAVVEPSFRSGRVHQASAGWEMEKYRVGTLGIQYLFARGERLPRPVEMNVGDRFPDLDRVVGFQSSGESTYHAVAFHTRARLFQQLFYTIAYTVSRADETAQTPIAMIFGGLNERNVLGGTESELNARAPANNDQRHHLAASAMYDTALIASERHGIAKTLLEHWELSTVYTLQSGEPYSAYTNGDINGDHNAFNDLAPLTTRNRYRLPWQGSLDARILRQFRIGPRRDLSLMWEAFNVANRPNYTAVDDMLYVVSGNGLQRNPLFGRKTGQADGRIMQLAVKATF